ncbi:hypothetical protein ACQ86G_22695 [Roseateles chitinivorans]|uniref:hypothetical protein n=1 Tax=Roseateles chitinivorans TaxID=2917965 RepID=UPI003D67A2B7
MLTLPHTLKVIGPTLRAEVLAFLQAIERARRFGFLVEWSQQTVKDSVGIDGALGVEWAPDHLGIALTGLPHAFAVEDIALVRRGVLHLLASDGDESAVRQAQTLATAVAEADERVVGELPVVSGAASTDFSQPFHLHLWFADPVEEPVLDGLADALGTLEQLAIGLRPLGGHVFADMGATSLSLLEPDHIQVWIDALHADPLDWQPRVGRMLARLNRRIPLRAIVYDES